MLELMHFCTIQLMLFKLLKCTRVILISRSCHLMITQSRISTKSKQRILNFRRLLTTNLVKGLLPGGKEGCKMFSSSCQQSEQPCSATYRRQGSLGIFLEIDCTRCPVVSGGEKQCIRMLFYFAGNALSVSGARRVQWSPIHPIPVQGAFHMLGVNTLELPLTESGIHYLIVFQDFLTKWPFVYPAPDQKATRIVRLLGEEIVPII